jgi:hypothetical protein
MVIKVRDNALVPKHMDQIRSFFTTADRSGTGLDFM